MNRPQDVIALVKDDAAHAPDLAPLHRFGFSVWRCTDLETLYARYAQRPCRLLVLSAALPDIQRAALHMRVMAPNIGIIAMPHLADSAARIHALQNGVDVCLAGNAAGLELAAALHALRRRMATTRVSVHTGPSAGTPKRAAQTTTSDWAAARLNGARQA